MDQDFADRCEDLLDDLEDLIEIGFHSRVAGDGLFRQLRHKAHSIREQAASRQYEFLTELAHRLEDFIDILFNVEDRHLRDIQTFVDGMREALHRMGRLSKQDRVAIIAGLPEARMDHVERTKDTAVDILLVVPEGTVARFISTELKECGYQVTTLCTSLDALRQILKAPPDLVLIAAALPDIPGIDLIRGLAAMTLTADIPVALITNQAPGQEIVGQLPAGVPVVRRGDDFSDDIAHTFAGFGIT